MSAIWLDTSGWIEITHDWTNAKKFSQFLTVADPIFVPTISLYAIARSTTRVAGEAAKEALRAILDQHSASSRLKSPPSPPMSFADGITLIRRI